MPEGRQVLADLLGELVQRGHEMVNTYLRGFTLFVLIIGGTLKFALDDNSTAELRVGLAYFGLVLSILGLLAGYFGQRVNRMLEQEIREIAEKIGIRPPGSFNQALTYLVVLAVSFIVCSVVGWIFLLFQYS